MLRAVIFGACLIAGAGVALAVEQREPDVGTCPELVDGQPSLLCDCPSEATATGSVWGSDAYTDDSAICRSALHSGAIGTGGGRVFVVEAPGQDNYPAVTRNSVASSRTGRNGGAASPFARPPRRAGPTPGRGSPPARPPPSAFRSAPGSPAPAPPQPRRPDRSGGAAPIPPIQPSAAPPSMPARSEAQAAR